MTPPDSELLGALSIGDDGKYRQIINVADGSEAHDAVTVRQLQNAIGAVATTPTKYFHANSTAEDSLAVGEDSLAMGAKTIVNGNVGIGIGYGAYVDANALNGIAIGSNAECKSYRTSVLRWVVVPRPPVVRKLITPPTTWTHRRILSVNSLSAVKTVNVDHQRRGWFQRIPMQT